MLDWLYLEKELWQAGFSCVAGVDEAGRGPLAGPVVAAAVIFAPGATLLAGINDSKKVSAGRREILFEKILQTALAVGVASASHLEIDRLNILRATYLAMNRAVAQLHFPADFLLVDGRGLPENTLSSRAVIKGDSLSMSIAAASIIAKVTRDRIMTELHAIHPEYGFAGHKGYPTREHIAAIQQHGLCPIHRRSFHPKALQVE